jgi:hypothetical protein
MIIENLLIFGLGTMTACINDDMLIIKEIPYAICKSGEKIDNSIEKIIDYCPKKIVKNQITLTFNIEDFGIIINLLNKINEENKKFIFKGYIFDLSRDIDNKSLNVLKGWFEEFKIKYYCRFIG